MYKPQRESVRRRDSEEYAVATLFGIIVGLAVLMLVGSMIYV